MKEGISLGGRSSTLFWQFFSLRNAHFPVCQEDHRTGLALCLAFLGCQDSCGIPSNGPVSSYSGSSVYIGP